MRAHRGTDIDGGTAVYISRIPWSRVCFLILAENAFGNKFFNEASHQFDFSVTGVKLPRIALIIRASVSKSVVEECVPGVLILGLV